VKYSILFILFYSIQFQGAVTRLHMSLNTPKALEIERVKPRIKAEVKAEVKTEIKAEPEETW
jgi:hypothetical protein